MTPARAHLVAQLGDVVETLEAGGLPGSGYVRTAIIALTAPSEPMVCEPHEAVDWRERHAMLQHQVTRYRDGMALALEKLDRVADAPFGYALSGQREARTILREVLTREQDDVPSE